VVPSLRLRVIQPYSLSLWSGPQTRWRESMSVRPVAAHPSTWSTSHQYPGTSRPGRVHPRSLAYRTIRCSGEASRLVRYSPIALP
jgi:hypothetical protein